MAELLRAAAAAPALELPRLWEALVFNWLIGNCDAHAKNFSLLYDAGAPTLAPLYDLVSTTVYPELTTRLAMRIAGAITIGSVTAEAWEQLAGEVGVRRQFALRTLASLAERVSNAIADVVGRPEHDDEIVERIAWPIRRRLDAALSSR